jgi:hypothetical protein
MMGGIGSNLEEIEKRFNFRMNNSQNKELV